MYIVRVSLCAGGSRGHIRRAVDLLQLDREIEGNPVHEEPESPLHVQQSGQRMG